jgi:hypothetical protein
MSDNESTPPLLQRPLQFGDAGMDELDPAVCRVGKPIQNFAVKNEGAHHLAGGFERVVERRVIEVAQIAAKPDQGASVFRHEAYWTL